MDTFLFFHHHAFILGYDRGLVLQFTQSNDAIKALLKGIVVADDKQLIEATHAPDLLSQVGAAEFTVTELELLRQNIEHIKDIVAMQQNYAKISGVTETVRVTDLVEDALGMNAGALARHGIEIIREYADVPPVTVEKHKVLQILVNLIRNAKYACDESGRKDKQLKLQVCRDDGRADCGRDNGIGISAENLSRIFNHGFTTRKDGHGFGSPQRRAGGGGNGRIADGAEQWSVSRARVYS